MGHRFHVQHDKIIAGCRNCQYLLLNKVIFIFDSYRNRTEKGTGNSYQ